MASAKRISTGYKGVFYIERQGEKILCIFYRKPGDRKQYEEKLGTSAQGWTPARANAERSRRINGQELTNNERRQAQFEAKRNAESRSTIERLWQLYLESKGDQLKGVVTDKNRFDLHLRKPVGNKTPQELVPLDIERLRWQAAKSHSVATTRSRRDDTAATNAASPALAPTAVPPADHRQLCSSATGIISFHLI